MFKKKDEIESSSEVTKLEVKKSDVQPKKVEKIKRPTQRDIVFNRVKELLKDRNIQVKPNQAVLECVNSELLKSLYDVVCKDFKEGKAILKDTPSNKEKLADDTKLRVYVVGLCSNWLRRDPRLNGEEKINL